MKTKEQHIWLQGAVRYGGSFVQSFAKTCLLADDENFALLSPILNQLMEKYPDYLSARFPE